MRQLIHFQERQGGETEKGDWGEKIKNDSLMNKRKEGKEIDIVGMKEKSARGKAKKERRKGEREGERKGNGRKKKGGRERGTKQMTMTRPRPRVYHIIYLKLK